MFASRSRGQLGSAACCCKSAIGVGELADRHVEEPEEDFKLHDLRPASRSPAIDGSQLVPQFFDPPVATSLVRGPDLLERLRVGDWPRGADGQPLTTVFGPVLGESGMSAEPPDLTATAP